jgi:hypothetical protein
VSTGAGGVLVTGATGHVGTYADLLREYAQQAGCGASSCASRAVIVTR